MSAAEFKKQFGGGVDYLDTPKSRPQIRLPKLRQPNKTEAEYRKIICLEYNPESNAILYEGITLRLPSGTNYTPDWVVVENYSGRVRRIYEVKGPRIHNSSSIRAFKEARSAFPFWTFTFAQKTKDGWLTT